MYAGVLIQIFTGQVFDQTVICFAFKLGNQDFHDFSEIFHPFGSGFCNHFLDSFT